MGNIKREIVACDVETTTINKGDPFNPRNKPVAIGFYNGENYVTYYKEFNIQEIQTMVNTSILVFTNGKFDLHWLRRLGIDFSTAIIRDVQLAEFIISNQTHPYASLDECALKYLKDTKFDYIKNQYWDKGIDTWFIPDNELIDYLKQDLKLTYLVHKQQELQLKEDNKYKLYLLQTADELELADIEWNGIFFNKEESIIKGNELEETISKFKNYIRNYTLCPSFNCSSGDHLSCLLYGGSISHTVRLPIGTYKSGAKQGQTRYKISTETYEQPKLIEPLKGSELKKEGYYSTDQNTLLSLKVPKKYKELIQAILTLSKIEKLQQTYYFGIPKKIEKAEWEGNLIHSQLNQCIVRTGRLSSSKPNQQNFDPELKKLCISRYENISN